MAFNRKKYAVYKVSDLPPRNALDPNTFFVVREDDINGAATLVSYVNQARLILACDLMFNGGFLSDKERQQLEERIAGVVQLAKEWSERRSAHIPD